jgi:type I restriction enzyme M protein
MAKKSYVKADEIQIKGNQIFSPVRRKWLPLTPEERVRLDYLSVLTDGYGYSIDQISEEIDVAGSGSAQARADFVIWRSSQDKTDQK